MAFSLYHATVPSFQQTIGATLKVLDKAEAFCAENGIESTAMVESKLAEDMLPFGYQVKSLCAHSIGAGRAVQPRYDALAGGPCWTESRANRRVGRAGRSTGGRT
jgi:hypothetical protein